MTRETTVGLVVSASFLCLLGAVFYCKLKEADHHRLRLPSATAPRPRAPEDPAPAPAADTNTTWAIPSPVAQPSVPGSRAPNTLDPSIIQATAQAAAGGDMPAPPGSPQEKANEASCGLAPASACGASAKEPSQSQQVRTKASPHPVDTATSSAAAPASPAAAAPVPTAVPASKHGADGCRRPGQGRRQTSSRGAGLTADRRKPRTARKAEFRLRKRVVRNTVIAWPLLPLPLRLPPHRGRGDRPARRSRRLVRRNRPTMNPASGQLAGTAAAPPPVRLTRSLPARLHRVLQAALAGANNTSVAGPPTHPSPAETMPPASPSGNSVGGTARGQCAEPGAADGGRRFASSGADARHRC